MLKMQCGHSACLHKKPHVTRDGDGCTCIIAQGQMKSPREIRLLFMRDVQTLRYNVRTLVWHLVLNVSHAPQFHWSME